MESKVAKSRETNTGANFEDGVSGLDLGLLDNGLDDQRVLQQMLAVLLL